MEFNALEARFNFSKVKTQNCKEFFYNLKIFLKNIGNSVLIQMEKYLE